MPNNNNNMNMSINNNNFNQNIMNNINNNNFGQNTNINNFGNMNQNMNMNNNNYYNPMMGMMPGNEDEEWLKGFQMSLEGVNNSNSFDKNEIEINFATTKGYKSNVKAKNGTTIDQLLKKYLEIENREYLINSKKVVYLYNGLSLKFGDNTKIENVFKKQNPTIIINDVDHLIGEDNRNIVFKHCQNKNISIIFGINSTVEELLDYYYIKSGKPKLILNKNIVFLYNAKAIQSSSLKIKVKDFFLNNFCPHIFVNE